MEAEGLELVGDAFGGLLVGDAAGLAVGVAIEDGQHIGELVLGDVVEGLGDLALAGLAVADDAVDAPVEPVEAGGLAEPGGDAQALAQRAGGGVEEGEALHGVGVPVELTLKLAEVLEVRGGQLAAARGVLAVEDAELGGGGVDRGDRVALAEHEPVAGGVVGVVGAPAHGVEHQHGDQVRDAQGAGRVAAAAGGGHLEAELADLDRLGVDRCFKGHAWPSAGGKGLRARRGAPAPTRRRIGGRTGGTLVDTPPSTPADSRQDWSIAGPHRSGNPDRPFGTSFAGRIGDPR